MTENEGANSCRSNSGSDKSEDFQSIFKSLLIYSGGISFYVHCKNATLYGRHQKRTGETRPHH
jgi:hypothetical protein